MEDYTIVWNAQSAGGVIDAGRCVLRDNNGAYVPSTSANRALYPGRKTTGFARTSADGGQVRNFNFQFVGLIDKSLCPTVGSGTEGQTVYVDSNGYLARGGTPGADDIVGVAFADGSVAVSFGGIFGGGGVTPGGVTGSVQGNNGSGGLTGYSTVLVGSGFLSIGSDPSTAGALRLSYGLFSGVCSNNSTDNDQVVLIALATRNDLGLGTDLVQVGSGSYNLYLAAGSGRTIHAWADDHRFYNGVGVESFRIEAYGVQFGGGGKDFGGGQGVIGIDNAAVVPSTNPTSGVVLYSESGTLKYRQPSGTIITLSGGGGTPTGTGLRKVVAGVEDAAASLLVDADVNAAAAIAGTKISPDFGSQNITTTGNIRRTSTLIIAGTDATNLYLGSDTSSANIFTNVRVNPNSAGILALNNVNHIEWTSDLVLMKPNNTPAARFTSSEVSFVKAVGGSSDDNEAFFFKRAAITKNDATDLTLSSTQYECPLVDISGTPGGNFNVIAPNRTGALFNTKNSTANTATWKKSGGTGVGVATNTTRWIAHNGTDYEARHV